MAVSAVVGMGRRTVSGMLCAGAEQFADWTAAYRVFAGERMDKEALFAPVRDAVIERLHEDEPLTVMMDDTIVRKRGRKVHGAGWKRDPLGPHFCNNFVWAQRFLQMSAALPDADCSGRARGIPLDLVHAPSPSKPRKKAADGEWEEYRRRQSVMKVGNAAVEGLRQLRRQVEKRKIVCAVDGGFTNQTVFRDEKTVMGAGQAQVRAAESVESVPQLVVASYAYLLLAGTAANARSLPLPKWRKANSEDRATTQMMQNLFRAQLWNIAVDANKTHFDNTTDSIRTTFYSNNALNSAVCYAYK